MNKPFIQLLTAAVIVKSIVLGKGPAGAVTNLVVNSTDVVVDIATGSANAIWRQFTSCWRPLPVAESQKQKSETKSKNEGQ